MERLTLTFLFLDFSMDHFLKRPTSSFYSQGMLSVLIDGWHLLRIHAHSYLRLPEDWKLPQSSH